MSLVKLGHNRRLFSGTLLQACRYATVSCKLGCEGIVSKRLGSRYRRAPGRCSDWIKVKNPAAPAVRREAEEDWGKRRWIQNRLAQTSRSPAMARRTATGTGALLPSGFGNYSGHPRARRRLLRLVARQAALLEQIKAVEAERANPPNGTISNCARPAARAATCANKFFAARPSPSTSRLDHWRLTRIRLAS
jgi:hypothetical protein